MKPGYQEHDRKLINHVYLVDGSDNYFTFLLINKFYISQIEHRRCNR